MQFSIEKKALERMVSVAAKVAPKRTTKPILSHLLFEADKSNQTLSMFATNEEISFLGTAPCSVVESGEFTLPAVEIEKVLKISRPTLMEFKLLGKNDAATVQIKQFQSKYQFAPLDVTQFPSKDFVNFDAPGDASPDTSFSTMPSATAIAAIDRVKASISHEEARYYLGGVYLEEYEERLRWVSTDGHRLSLVETELPPGFFVPGTKSGVIVPRKFLEELQRMVGEHQEFQLALEGKRITAKCPGAMLSSLLVEGSFPSYNQFIPSSWKQGSGEPDVRCFHSQLEECLKSVGVLTSQALSGVRLEIKQGAPHLQFSVQQSNGHQAETKVLLWGGKAPSDIEMGLNILYLQDAISAISALYVGIMYTNHMSPIVLIPSQAPDTSEPEAETSTDAVESDESAESGEGTTGNEGESGGDGSETAPKEAPKDASTGVNDPILTQVHVVMPMRL